MIPPLRFERLLLEKVWGGRALETALGFDLPADQPIGETWELVDRDDAVSVVATGELAGRTLRELLAAHPREILGAAPANARGAFPLLVKFIDASENLSVQVHPDDAAAKRLGGGAEGKTEAWYVVATEPGAAVWAGVKPEIGAEEFAARVTREGAEELLVRWEVRPGDCVSVPGGVVHAIGAGVTLLEVQQNSDTTYRLYDWGRVGLDGRPRETHVDAGLAVAEFGGRISPVVRATDVQWNESEGLRGATLARSDYFAIDVREVRAKSRLDTAGSFAIQVVVKGEGRMTSAAGGASLALGDTWLVPAETGTYEIEPGPGGLTLVQLTSGTR